MQLGISIGIPSTLGKVAAFSPLDLSPVLWLDASDTSTITESGGSVSQWDDKSGNGNDVTQGTAALQPTTGTRTLNGLNVLDFIDDRLGGTFAGGNIAQPFTLVAVATSDLATAGYRYIAHGDSPSSYLGFIGSANLALGGGVVLTSSTGGTDPHIIVATANSTSSLIRVDGNETTGDAGTRAFNTPFGIGAFSTPASYWDGTIAEIIVVDGTLTADQITATESYLASKWGITL